jgi:gas vesicle protein
METAEANSKTVNETGENNENNVVNETKESNENKETNDNQTQQKEESSGYSMNLAIIGGLVGAGIGLLANQETGKKVFKNLSESEFVKTAGQEFRKTAQELLAGQAQSSVKNLASGYLSKIEEGLLSPKTESGGKDQENYEEIKEENKQLNERLQSIEKMLNDLVETK